MLVNIIIIDACKYYYKINNRRITLEYTVIEGINNREKDLKELMKILKGLNCHINLIPLNPIEEYSEGRPLVSNIEKFQQGLIRAGIPTTIRKEMGSDINASCGQLRRRYINGRDS